MSLASSPLPWSGRLRALVLGTSFARFTPGDAALDHPAFTAMKATWEASTGAASGGSCCWKVHNDWEEETAFIPQSSLESLVRMVVAR